MRANKMQCNINSITLGRKKYKTRMLDYILQNMKHFPTVQNVNTPKKVFAKFKDLFCRKEMFLNVFI